MAQRSGHPSPHLAAHLPHGGWRRSWRWSASSRSSSTSSSRSPSRQSGPQRAHPRRAGDRRPLHVPPGVPALSGNQLGQFADRRRRRPRQAAAYCSRPMAAMLNAGAGASGLSTLTTRAILNSIATRLDEGRELSRYLVGLLVFLGLLGTFWGLLETVHSISGVIESMKTGSDTASMFDDLKAGPLVADRRHERLVHLVALRPRKFVDSRLSRSSGGPGAEPLLFRVRGVSREPRRRRRAGGRAGSGCANMPQARSPRSSISVTRRPSRRSPKASRLSSATCGPNSSRSAIGSTPGDAAGRYRQAPAAAVRRTTGGRIR